MRLKFATLATISLLSVPAFARAQQPQTREGAYAAAAALLVSRHEVSDTSRIVPDSAAVYARFVRCSMVNGHAGCELLDEKPVASLQVRLDTPTLATIDIRYYVTLRRSCPRGRAFPAPVIAVARTEVLKLNYAGGKWMQVGSAEGIEC